MCSTDRGDLEQGMLLGNSETQRHGKIRRLCIELPYLDCFLDIAVFCNSVEVGCVVESNGAKVLAVISDISQ